MEIQAAEKKRPTFLTVICILSFVGLGWGLINDLITITFGAVLSPFFSFIQNEMQQGLNEASAADPTAAFFIENIFWMV